MTDNAVRCPTRLTSECAESVFYDDSITDLGDHLVPPTAYPWPVVAGFAGVADEVHHWIYTTTNPGPGYALM